MQVLHITANGKARVVNLDEEGEGVLEGLQRLVDGAVTCIGTDVIRSGLALDIWANDEGLLRSDFAVNEKGSLLAGQHLVGPVVVADVDDYGNTLSLSARHLNLLRDRLGIKIDDNKGVGYTLEALVS
jgi:hypothetical protein